jgi:hypothetical protein
MTFKGSELDDIAMIQAKLGDGLADFQTVTIMKCFEWWHDCGACCIRPQEDNYQGDNSD